jgi:subtilisin family serine protease
MRRAVVILTVTMLVCASAAGAAGRIGSELSLAMEKAREGELIRIYVIPTAQPDLSSILARIDQSDRQERRSLVTKEMKQFALASQGAIIDLLRREEALGNVRRVRSLWASNVVRAEANPATIAKLAQLESVARIELVRYENALLEQRQPNLGTVENLMPQPLMPDTVWNITLVDAPCAWAQGYRGQNVIVGHFDTGVNYDHVDLADHMWVNTGEIPNNWLDDDGNGYVDDYYGYDFNGWSGDPMDDNGHGTHTAGTVAGDGTAGRATGVAPDARIMALKVLDWYGAGTEADVWEAIDYGLDMGADVLTFSIGWLHYSDPDRSTWRGTFNVVRLAGVSAAVAAGNEREYWMLPWWYPPPHNLRTPGDVPPPWLHPDQTMTGGLSGVVSVGATDVIDSIADFSSYGPVSWDSVSPYLDYPYNPEMGLIDPDVAAPGVSVTSLRYDTNNGYVGGASWSGTSMACPHVAGLMALMLSKNGSLTPAKIDSIIESTCLELGTAGKDNDYGSGRIRVCEAVNAVPVGVEEGESAIAPGPRPFLFARPNPFGRETEIAAGGGVHRLEVYDALGRVVALLELPRAQESASSVTLRWEGRDARGNLLEPGVYFLRAGSGYGDLTSKLVILR